MSRRDESIDIMKGLLVVGMVLAHIIQFYGENSFVESKISTFINLISFSGYLFCFGYANQKAYFSRSIKQSLYRMAKTAIKTLLAFYISGILFTFIVGKEPFEMDTIINILVLNKIPGYSEFLASFAAITFLSILLFKPIVYLLKQKLLFWFVIVCLLFTTFFPYNVIFYNQLGLFLGTTKFASFSVLQYLPFFLVGAYFAKYEIKINFKYFTTSFILTLITLIYYILERKMPSRFPVSLFWLIGSPFFLYVYFVISNIIKNLPTSKLLGRLGKNVLFYLLVTNTFIFIFSTIILFKLSFIYCVLFAFILLVVVNFMISIINKPIN